MRRFRLRLSLHDESKERRSTIDEQRQKLQEIRSFIKQNGQVLKPYFGLLFWEVVELGEQADPEKLASEGMQISLGGDQDEILGTFLTHFVQIWQSAGDLNAACRFMAASLAMSADELIETRQLHQKRPY